MVPATVLTMVDGVRVVVPDSLDLITPYVLREQHDWFEDEIKFLRHLLQPGQKVIDVGANYGVYTLSMAQAVGPTGHVWAFEPASSTACLLAEGIAANGFSHITLERSALSNTGGSAQLSLNDHSELNALLHDEQSTGTSETVTLVTLDDRMESYGWTNIEFVKIDAEGEEANILKGGRRFFAELSPLVLYEVKAGDRVHMELVRDFAALGYKSYRLVPGLDLLVPFNTIAPPDAFLLNLFCCKPDRAAALASCGLLAEAAAIGPDTWMAWLKHLSNQNRSHDAYGWRHTLVKLPYGATLADLWERTVATRHSDDVEKALLLYAVSRDPSWSRAERFGALEGSFNHFRILCKNRPSHLRLASLARVARDYGARLVAVDALVQLLNSINRNRQADPGEPFLAPGERFDSVPPGEAIGDWIRAAVLEEIERIGFFSSFYSGASARQRLETIRDLKYGGAEMHRRLTLLQQRFGLPVQEAST